MLQLRGILRLFAVLAWLLTSCYAEVDVGDGSSSVDGGEVNSSVEAVKRQIRLGTWNIQQFGKRDPRRTDEQVAAVAEFIKNTGVDVLAVQEIGGVPAMQKLMSYLGDDYSFTLGSTNFAVGFLWNRQLVELLQSEEMLDFPSRADGLPILHRKPVNAVFRVKGENGFDFRAINVHLKAGKPELDPKSSRKRQAEVKILREYLARLLADESEDQDIIVLGDFNHSLGDPAYQVFVADDFVEYVANPAPTPMGSATIMWFKEPIDHFAMTSGIREEVIPGSHKVHSQLFDFASDGKDEESKNSSKWLATYSDHFPVTIDLDASKDRDPDAGFAGPKHKLAIGSAK